MKQKLMNWHRGQSTSKVMFMASMAAFIVVIAVSDICLMLQFENVRQIQSNFSSGFYEVNLQFSLQQIAKQTTQLMQVGMDFQTNYLLQIKGCILNFNHSLIEASQVNIKPTQMFQTKDYNEPALYISQTNSMFSAGVHGAVNDLLRNIASPIITLRLKRINVWYQSLTNESDFMVKTLPGDKNFQPQNKQDVSKRMKSSQAEVLTVFGPYLDTCSTSPGTPAKLLALRTKLIEKDFVILIEVQMFAYLTNKVLGRVKYSEETNVIFVAATENGYSVIGNTNPLDSQIDYLPIVQPGYHQTTLPSGLIMSSYTQPLPAEYDYGSINGNSKGKKEGPLRIIVTSHGVSQEMKKQIDLFIENSYTQKTKFLAMFTCILAAMMVCLACYMERDISHSLSFVTDSLRNFTLKPQQKITRISFSSQVITSKWDDLKFFHAKIYPLIKKIQDRIRKNQKKVDQIHNQGYLKNLLYSGFCQNHQIQDIQKLSKLKQQITMAQKVLTNID